MDVPLQTMVSEAFKLPLVQWYAMTEVLFVLGPIPGQISPVGSVGAVQVNMAVKVSSSQGLLVLRRLINYFLSLWRKFIFTDIWRRRHTQPHSKVLSRIIKFYSTLFKSTFMINNSSIQVPSEFSFSQYFPSILRVGTKINEKHSVISFHLSIQWIRVAAGILYSCVSWIKGTLEYFLAEKHCSDDEFLGKELLTWMETIFSTEHFILTGSQP